MTATTTPGTSGGAGRGGRGGGIRGVYAGNARTVMLRSWTATWQTNWLIVVSGFFEPVLYLLSLGVGLGPLVGKVSVDGVHAVPYAAFIAPALLATSAVNGAIADSTWNVFFKLRFGKIYEAMLTTSLGPLDVALGEILMALARGALYGIGFLIVMQVLGLNMAWTALLALPALVLIAFGIASAGMCITSYLKSFQQMDWINFVLLPMFLLSATFYPITVYPAWAQRVIEVFPLWHGVELVRALTTGYLSIGVLWHVIYFLVLIALGLVFTTRRLRALFLK